MRTQLVDGLFADLLQVVRFLRVYYRFSACVDANYDIKESIKDIQQTVQSTLYVNTEHFYYKQDLLAIGD